MNGSSGIPPYQGSPIFPLINDAASRPASKLRKESREHQFSSMASHPSVPVVSTGSSNFFPITGRLSDHLSNDSLNVAAGQMHVPLESAQVSDQAIQEQRYILEQKKIAESRYDFNEKLSADLEKLRKQNEDIGQKLKLQEAKLFNQDIDFGQVIISNLELLDLLKNGIEQSSAIDKKLRSQELETLALQKYQQNNDPLTINLLSSLRDRISFNWHILQELKSQQEESVEQGAESKSTDFFVAKKLASLDKCIDLNLVIDQQLESYLQQIQEESSLLQEAYGIHKA